MAASRGSDKPCPYPSSLNTKSMEEVWNHIKLSSLSDVNAFSSSSSSSSSTTSHSSFRTLVLHEFLSSTPFLSDSHSSLSLSLHHPSSLSPPNKTHHLPLLQIQQQPQPAILTLSSSSFPALDSPNSNKRTRQFTNHPTDRRHKRMIKNRESAARSRARKQAYTNELEHELAILREENARLRQQLEKYSLRPLDQRPKKHTLLRTLTAPF